MSNCYLYALGQWFRHGGWVIVRKSKYWFGPHMLWTPNLLDFYEYVPVDKSWYRERWLPPPIFHGEVHYVPLHRIKGLPRSVVGTDD